MKYNQPSLANPTPPKRLDVTLAKCNYAAASSPSAGDDRDLGYQENSLWYVPTEERLFVCVDPADDAAIWIEIQTGEDVVETGKTFGYFYFNAANKQSKATATATSSQGGYEPARTLDGIRHSNATENYWAGNSNVLPQTLTVDFGQSREIFEIDIITLRDDYNTTYFNPLPTDTFTKYGAVDYTVDLLDAFGVWKNVATVVGNNLVWRQFVIEPTVATKMRTTITRSVTGTAYLVECEAWAQFPMPPPKFNAALSVYGGLVSATSMAAAALPPSATNNGMRYTGTWGSSDGESGWQSSAGFPQTLTVDFGTFRSISEIDICFLADPLSYTTDPDENLTGNVYVVTDFTVEYFDGSAWHNLATVTGNNHILRKFVFPTVKASQTRVTVTASKHTNTLVVEFEAWQSEAWLIDFDESKVEGTGIAPQMSFWKDAKNIGSAPYLEALANGEALKVSSRPWLVPSCLNIKPSFDGGSEYYGANHNDLLQIDGTGSQVFGRYGGGTMNLFGVTDGYGRSSLSVSPWGDCRINFFAANDMTLVPSIGWGERAAFTVYADSGGQFYTNTNLDVLRVTHAGVFGYYTGTQLCMIRADEADGSQYFQVWRGGRANIRKALAVGAGVVMDNSVPASTIDVTDATGLDQLQIGYDHTARLRFFVDAAGGSMIEALGTVPSLSICPDPSTQPFGVFGATPVGQQVVTGTRSNADGALTNLLIALDALGWIDDQTVA